MENKKILPVLAIGIILILAIAIGGKFWISGKQKVQTPATQNTKTVKPTSQTIATDETAGWQTYLNEEYGFEVKYPVSYEVLINDPNGKKYPSFRDKKYNGFEWPGLTLDYDPIFSSDFNIESKKFNIGETKNELIKIFFIDGDKKIYATCAIYQGNAVVEVCNQILSTFKFIDSIDETANWQTYRNEKYGFEIKYPPKYRISDYTNRDIPRSPTVVEHNNPIAYFIENGKGDLTAYIEWWDGENDHLNFHKSKPDFQIKIKEKYIVVDYTPGVGYIVSPELKKEWEKILSTFKFID